MAIIPNSGAGQASTTTARALQKNIGNAPNALGGTISAQNQALDVGQQNQIQQAVSSQTPVTSGQIQQAGAQQAQAKGQATNAATAKSVQQTGQQGQIAEAANEDQVKNDLAKSSLKLDQDTNALANDLDTLGQGLKNELFDKQMEFQKDELGRTQFNDRQLMDYALATAKSDEEMAQWQDDMNYYSTVRLQILQASGAKIEQAMQQASANGEFEKDAQLKVTMANKVAEIKRKIAEEQNKQKNKAAMYSAVGTVVGAAAGSFGGPAGAMAGAAAGSALGNLAASQS